MKKCDYWILFDCNWESCDKKWLYEELKSQMSEGQKIEIVERISLDKNRGGILYKIYSYFIIVRQVITALHRSKKDDVLVCWNFLTGIFANLLSKVCRNSRKIVSMCWLTPTKADGRPIISALERSLINNPNAYITVNDRNGAEKWNNFHHTKSSHFVFLPDTYNDSLSFLNPHVRNQKAMIFCGGRANRHWKLLVEIASCMPTVKFICVAEKNDWHEKIKGLTLPNNVEALFEIKSKEYYQLMASADLALIPLEKNVSSGFINITMSAQLGVPCIVTKNTSTETYFAEHSGLVIDNDKNLWIDGINRILSLPQENFDNLVREFQNHIKKNFSPQHNAKIIYDIFH